MSDDERLDWFPCKPGPLLGALAGMSAPEQQVYLIVLLRIYENGGACPDTLSALSLRTRLNKRVLSEVLDSLFRAERLYRGEGGIRNPKADKVIADSMALREKRKTAAAGAANSRWEKSKQSQESYSAKRKAGAMRFDAQLQLQDSLFPEGKRAQEPEKCDVNGSAPSHSESAAMKDPPLDPEADFYRRGREVLGASAGGMLTQLLRAKGGNVALARAAIEQASTRGDAKQYVGAMVRGVNGGGANGTDRNNRGPRLGAAGIAARLRKSIAERERSDCDSETFFAAGDHEPADGSRHPPSGLGAMDRSRQAAATAPSSGAFGAGGPRSP